VDWLTSEPQPLASYRTYIRFDTDFPKGTLYHESYGKLYRKIIENFKGERFRFRTDRIPFQGVYPPEKWSPGQVFREYFSVAVPEDVVPGIYTISVRIHHPPHVSNLRIRDLLRNDDFYDGPDLMKVYIK